MSEKEYTIIKTRNDRETEITGTLDYLKEYFGYTLEVGHSWNHKINKNPKTIKSFIKNLELSLEEQEGGCFNRTYIELVN